MVSTCRQENCTVAETGICLLNNDALTCPERQSELQPATTDLLEEVAPPLPTPLSKPKFNSSGVLSQSSVRDLMSKRYCRVIGILGAPDAGKTASLVSLYLLLSKAKLSGFEYADSQSLMAFDEISRGARRWNEGALPDQMTAHTELLDDREPGYLHLQLATNQDAKLTDILLPDLPGEWSVSLAENNRTDRWSFLHRADVIWLMVDGVQLAEAKTRLLAIHRIGLFLGRLKDFVPATPEVFLVVTRKDKGQPSAATIDAITREATTRAIELTIFEIASFAEEGNVQPGEGLAELMQASVRSKTKRPAFWPDSHGAVLDRSINLYRSSQS